MDILFEVSNGLTGMMRDVILRLCHLFEMNEKNSMTVNDRIVRALIGICQEHMQWRKHSYFLKSRLEVCVNIPIVFMPVSAAVKKVTVVGCKVTAGEGCNGNYMVVDSEMKTGIYKVVFVSSGNTASTRPCGLVDKSSAGEKFASHGGEEMLNKMCTICSEGIFFYHIRDSVEIPIFEQTEGNITFALELHCGIGVKCVDAKASEGNEQRTGSMYIFIDGVQIPYTIASIPYSSYFFHMGVFHSFTVEVRSLQRLTARTADTLLLCRQCKWMD